MANTSVKIQDCSILPQNLVEEFWHDGPEPGEPGWMLIKFLCDTVPSERLALILLLDAERDGAGIRFTQRSGKGCFSSDADFARKHGFGFEVSHHEYNVDRLGNWFLQTTDGCWNHVFSPLASERHSTDTMNSAHRKGGLKRLSQ